MYFFANEILQIASFLAPPHIGYGISHRTSNYTASVINGFVSQNRRHKLWKNN